jgi:phosphatidylglycerophosphate synthase
MKFDKVNAMLNLIQIICFIAVIYIGWYNHLPSAWMAALIFFVVALDVLSGYQARRETEKEHKEKMEALQ